MPMLLSHFVTAYPSPSPYPQVHSLVGLCRSFPLQTSPPTFRPLSQARSSQETPVLALERLTTQGFFPVEKI